MPQAPFRPRAGVSSGGRTAKLTCRGCNELEPRNRLLPPRSGAAPRSAGLWGGGTASRGRNGQRTVQGPLHVPPPQDAPDQPQRRIPEERPGLDRVRPADPCRSRLAALREPPLPVGLLGQPAQWAGEAADSIAEPARSVLVPGQLKSDELLLTGNSSGSNVHDGCHTTFDKFFGIKTHGGRGIPAPGTASRA